MAKPGTPLTKLQEAVHHALKAWHEAGDEASPLEHLRIFQLALLDGASNARQATNQILLEALKTLAVNHEEEAELLRRRFLDGLVMHAIAGRFNIGEATAYRKQQDAIRHLALILQAKEAQVREEYQASLERRLKLPPEVELYGVEEDIRILRQTLISPKPPWIISIEGLGGIGKTALANALVRQPDLTVRFFDVAWFSVKQQQFLPGVSPAPDNTPAVTAEDLVEMLLEQLAVIEPLPQSPQEKQAALLKLLKNASYLIVIDNLETMVDYQTLLPLLRTLANPSKFLLTSRHSLRIHPDVFCHNLAELNQAEAIRFIAQEAQVRGIYVMAAAAKAELESIYQVVGGHPLALKLVVGQASVLPLSHVLRNLKQAKTRKIGDLYTYIYWQAWHMLNDASRQALLIMPLAQDGDLDQLLALSRLELDELGQALEQLTTLSLVQVSGNLEERRYTIHRLTETFLLNEAIRWQSLA